MIITDREYDSLIERLQSYTDELNRRYTNQQRLTILGNIGEKFVGYCICHGLWKLGYAINFQHRPHSFILKPKYGADAQGRGGVDFHLTITNLDEQRYQFLIEAKNWNYYRSISRDTCRQEIISRYTRVDADGVCFRLLTMNRRNIRHIQASCQENNIRILPMRGQLTSDYVWRGNDLREDYGSFIEAFCSLITELAPESSYPYLLVERDRQRRYEVVIQDLLMGVSYNVIQRRYDVSDRYVMKLASLIRSFNIPLPDRRRKDWRAIWELQD